MQTEVFEAADSLLKSLKTNFGQMLDTLYRLRLLPYMREIKKLEGPRKKINECGVAMRELQIIEVQLSLKNTNNL